MSRVGPLTALRNSFAVLFEGQNLLLAVVLCALNGSAGLVVADQVAAVVFDRYLLGQFTSAYEQAAAANNVTMSAEAAAESAAQRLAEFNTDPDTFRKKHRALSVLTQGQQPLLVSQLSQLVVSAIWNCFVGAFAASAAIYMWVQHHKKQSPTVYGGINYAINRYPRVLGAHSAAFLTIALGNIIIVPGILFGMQYAFVDAIATLDDRERAPLARSRALSALRRGTVFRTFAMFLVWWVPFQFFTFYMQGMGLGEIALGGFFDHFVLLLIDLCMVQIYLDLFGQQK